MNINSRNYYYYALGKYPPKQYLGPLGNHPVGWHGAKGKLCHRGDAGGAMHDVG